jgi:hypothetical protein
MTKDEALKMALEVMRNQGDVSVDEWIATEKAIKEALAQPEQEPVAWRAWVSKFPQGTGSDWVYVTKPIMKDSVHNQPLYTTPSQRAWVGLTDEEIKRIGKLDLDSNYFGLWYDFAKAIEVKLKEKNT